MHCSFGLGNVGTAVGAEIDHGRLAHRLTARLGASAATRSLSPMGSSRRLIITVAVVRLLIAGKALANRAGASTKTSEKAVDPLSVEIPHSREGAQSAAAKTAAILGQPAGPRQSAMATTNASISTTTRFGRTAISRPTVGVGAENCSSMPTTAGFPAADPATFRVKFRKMAASAFAFHLASTGRRTTSRTPSSRSPEACIRCAAQRWLIQARICSATPSPRTRQTPLSRPRTIVPVTALRTR